jgi:hypothetical protein
MSTATQKDSKVLYDLSAIPADSKIHAHVKPFGKGDVAKYRVYGSFDPLTKKYSLRDLYVPNTDVIMDPDTGESYDIGYVVRVGEGGKPVLGDIWFSSDSLCILILHGGQVQHRKIYNYLERCNYNVSNPNRDTSAMPLIERIDDGSDAEASRRNRKRLYAAFDAIEGMTDDEVSAFNIANGVQTFGSAALNRAELENWVERYGPDRFFRASIAAPAPGSVDTTLQFIKNLQKKERIAFNKTTKKWTTIAGDTVLVLQKGHGDPLHELANYLDTQEGKAGMEILKDLK